MASIPISGRVGAVVTHLRGCTSCSIALISNTITVNGLVVIILSPAAPYLTVGTPIDDIHHVLTDPLLEQTEEYEVDKALGTVSYGLWEKHTG